MRNEDLTDSAAPCNANRQGILNRRQRQGDTKQSQDVLNVDRMVVKSHSFQLGQWLGFGGSGQGTRVQHHSQHQTKAEAAECLTEKSHDEVRCTGQYVDDTT